MWYVVVRTEGLRLIPVFVLSFFCIRVIRVIRSYSVFGSGGSRGEVRGPGGCQCGSWMKTPL